MPRDLPLSNGRLLVAFDRDALIRDIYFPHVGKENHATGHAFRVGVWVDQRFSWLGKDWDPRMCYADESMASDITAHNPDLAVMLSFEDVVDFYENVLVRHVVVKNESSRAREIRVFFHHDFRIGGTEVGDTAFFDPETCSLIHYKDDRYFLMNCVVDGEVGIPRYACGTKEVAGSEGTWRDAEDGQLSGNAIAQGSVDSTAGIPLQVPANGTGDFYYWMAAGTHYREVTTVNQVVRDKTPAELLRRTRNYWHLWVGKDRRSTGDLSPLAVKRYQQSLLIIRSQIDHTGAVIAANDTDIMRFARDTYSYMWPRDGALVCSALMHAGHAGAVEAFLGFCARHISPNGYMRHKYNPDGTLASSWHGYIKDGRPVLPIQEDETALVVWAVWQYFELFRRIEETAPFYRSLVTRPADFMLKYVDPRTGLPQPSHDLWEERWGVHAYTVAAVIAGLRAAGKMCEAFGETERAARYAKGAERMLEGMRTVLWNEEKQRFARMATPTPDGYTLDMTLDSSLFALTEFAVLPADDPQVQSTLEQVAAGLRVDTPIGGLARYENDYYQQVEKQDTKRVPGNPWFISTMWLARYHVRRAEVPEELDKARELIEWAASRALPSGTMAEQLHPYTGEPLSVSPLTWSHASYVSAVREYLERATRLNLCPTCGQPVARAVRASEALAAQLHP